MRAKLVSFWLDHVQADVPPDPLVFDDIKELFPSDNGLAIEATQDIVDKVSALREVKARIKEFEEAEEALKFEIAEFISPHARLSFGGADVATWKGQNTTRLDQDALAGAELYRRDESTGEFLRIAKPIAEFSRTSVVRVLRLTKPKKGNQ